jgi:ABC-type antimicrobial peptide transport system permease subunit
VPMGQVPLRDASVIARASGSDAPQASALALVVSDSLPGSVETYGLRTGGEIISDFTARARFTAIQLSVFSGLAVVLAMAGVYSVLSLYSSERVREIGIRMALGSTPAAVTRLVLWQGVRPVAIGISCGWAGAAVVARLLGGPLSTSASGWAAAFAGSGGCLIAVALVAGCIPAWRAARTDPLEALRHN